jgi:hypothetical protein
MSKSTPLDTLPRAKANVEPVAEDYISIQEALDIADDKPKPRQQARPQQVPHQQQPEPVPDFVVHQAHHPFIMSAPPVPVFLPAVQPDKRGTFLATVCETLGDLRDVRLALIVGAIVVAALHVPLDVYLVSMQPAAVVRVPHFATLVKASVAFVAILIIQNHSRSPKT